LNTSYVRLFVSLLPLRLQVGDDRLDLTRWAGRETELDGRNDLASVQVECR
jgi:hypothetical protein